MPKLSIVISCDTRPGADAEFHEIKNYGGGNLCGVHSLDFLTAGVVAKNRFLESAGFERETILFVDLHEAWIPGRILDDLEKLLASGEITRLITQPHSKARHRWNDHLMLDALAHASPTSDFVAHWDGDCIGYRRPDFDVLKMYVGLLDSGYKFICQQTPLNQGEHLMFWASTRFFLCRRESLDLPELRRLIDDDYRRSKFGSRHLPCVEHILGAMAGENSVLYPPSQNQDFAVWSWVHYFRGVIQKLNKMSYEDVYRYVFETCGGPLGASDLIGREIP